jgi:hypothetical protein
LVRSCPNAEQAGSVWFLAPADEHYVAGGSTLTGVYESAGQLPSFYTWSLEKVA